MNDEFQPALWISRLFVFSPFIILLTFGMVGVTTSDLGRQLYRQPIRWWSALLPFGLACGFALLLLLPIETEAGQDARGGLLLFYLPYVSQMFTGMYHRYAGPRIDKRCGYWLYFCSWTTFVAIASACAWISIKSNPSANNWHALSWFVAAPIVAIVSFTAISALLTKFGLCPPKNTEAFNT